MIEGRSVRKVWLLCVKKYYYDTKCEELKKASGFVGTTNSVSLSKKGLKPVYFASPIEAKAFADSHADVVYLYSDFDNFEKGIVLTQEYPVFSDWYSNDEWRAWYKKPKNSSLDIVKMSTDELEMLGNSFADAMKDRRVSMSELLKEHPLEKFALVREDSREEFEFDGSELVCNSFQGNERALTGRCFDIKAASGGGLDYDSALDFKHCGISDEKNFVRNSLWVFFIVNWFIKNLPAHYTKRTKKVKPKNRPKNRNNKEFKGKLSVVLVTEYEANLKGITRKFIRHEIKCLCWGVRGHVRHYKNGNEVFIKPYKKGKERNNENAYVAKTYIKEMDAPKEQK